MIGQAAPACRVFKAAGLRVTVVDSDLTTAPTDPALADSTYLEPVDSVTVEKIIAKELPDTLFLTHGGQAALDTTVALYESGVLTRYGVELIGTGIDAILAGGEFAVSASAPGRRKVELELVRDHEGKVAVACLREESGTLTERTYQRMCDEAVELTRAAGPGGCTIGFAVDPCDGRPVVTGFDPRVIRSSAIAAELALGRTLGDIEVCRDRVVADAAGIPTPDRFRGDAIEIDVDALYDGSELYLGGVMERFETACALPPITLGQADLLRIRESTRALAESIGPLNVRYALESGVLDVLEATPRAGDTVPFVAKATGVPLAEATARVMRGATIADLRAEGLLPAIGDGGTVLPGSAIAVKLGEKMGIDSAFGAAYAKTQAAAAGPLPTKGRVFVSFADRDNRAMIFPVKALADAGFEILTAERTGDVLRRVGLPATILREPSIVDLVRAGELVLVVDTLAKAHEVRAAAAARGVPCFSTVRGFAAAVQGIDAVDRGRTSVVSLQEHVAGLRSVREGLLEGPRVPQGGLHGLPHRRGDL
ncbi:MAG TPA: hypothetical protein VFG15_11865 [Amycolatopsis sp.]|nr:hypothetical protein [Amycolatopsis sp.]